MSNECVFQAVTTCNLLPVMSYIHVLFLTRTNPGGGGVERIWNRGLLFQVRPVNRVVPSVHSLKSMNYIVADN